MLARVSDTDSEEIGVVHMDTTQCLDLCVLLLHKEHQSNTNKRKQKTKAQCHNEVLKLPKRRHGQKNMERSVLRNLVYYHDHDCKYGTCGLYRWPPSMPWWWYMPIATLYLPTVQLGNRRG